MHPSRRTSGGRRPRRNAFRSGARGFPRRLQLRVHWGGTTVLHRDAAPADVIATVRADVALGASGAQLSHQSWGTALALPREWVLGSRRFRRRSDHRLSSEGRAGRRERHAEELHSGTSSLALVRGPRPRPPSRPPRHVDLGNFVERELELQCSHYSCRLFRAPHSRQWRRSPPDAAPPRRWPLLPACGRAACRCPAAVRRVARLRVSAGSWNAGARFRKSSSGNAATRSLVISAGKRHPVLHRRVGDYADIVVLAAIWQDTPLRSRARSSSRAAGAT